MNRLETKEKIIQFLKNTDIPLSVVFSIYEILVTQQPEDFITEHMIMDENGCFRPYRQPRNDNIVESFFY